MSEFGDAVRSVRQMEAEHQGQLDYLDGAALRRLREVLPEGSVVTVYIQPPPGNFDVGFTSDTMKDDEDWLMTGATIAEAADKCREVLMGVRNG